MISFLDYVEKVNEEILRKIDLMNAIRRSGIPFEVIRNAFKYISINDLLESPPPEVKGAYALGLSSISDGMKGVYFYVARALGLVEWPSAYAKAFGKRWASKVDQVDVTDRFLDNITSDNKYIVFFVPNNALNLGRYTREEVEYFMRNTDKLARVIFVFGTYDMVDPADYENLIAANRTKDQRKNLVASVLKSPKDHIKPGAVV